MHQRENRHAQKRFSNILFEDVIYTWKEDHGGCGCAVVCNAPVVKW